MSMPSPTNEQALESSIEKSLCGTSLEELKAKGLTDYVRENTGLVIDSYFSGTKIEWLLENIPGATIIYNNLCSKSVPETIKKLGGNPLMWKTGHSFIKSKIFFSETVSDKICFSKYTPKSAARFSLIAT